MEILEQEKRRASNIIWNAAQNYDFEPDFKAFDEYGQADLYWNSIIGAVRKKYDAQIMEKLFSDLAGSEDEVLYEQLIWLGLEHAVYRQEAELRPALPSLRRNYAQRILSQVQRANLLEILEEGYFRRVLGEDPPMTHWNRKILDGLEFSDEWDTQTLCTHALQFLKDSFGFIPVQNQGKRMKKPGLFPSKRKDQANTPSGVRKFGLGYSEHLCAGNQDQTGPARRIITDTSAEKQKKS